MDLNNYFCCSSVVNTGEPNSVYRLTKTINKHFYGDIVTSKVNLTKIKPSSYFLSILAKLWCTKLRFGRSFLDNV